MTSEPTQRHAALLIHGLGGTEYDLGSMHKILRRAGLDTHGITLPGHGLEPNSLLDVSAEQWLDAARDKYRDLLGQYESVHLIGMCMGALLAIEVAKQERHQRGRLVALAPPIFIDGWSTPWYARLRFLLYRLPLVPRRMRVVEEEPFGIKNDMIRAIVKAKFARGENFHYRWVPLHCVQQVDRLRHWVMSGLRQILCPTLVVHAREDELTSVKSAEFLQREIGDERVAVTIVENSYHMICIDNDREQVAANVLAHLGLDPEIARRSRRSAGAGDALAERIARRATRQQANAAAPADTAATDAPTDAPTDETAALD
ncbi:alpha/beta hydrolase [Chitinasiproducens palmae]|uniref:Carboxylesterase n=1 Tax=Chitinasiproducens palmae TaxID=1770053 RepID=A0A1H2PVV4_9BURK|nr:alpha/beta fold hydrolase [Chitinasiproducens palmae]SDV51457.1 carboxylesterase [Chitinasiproducens palmae]